MTKTLPAPADAPSVTSLAVSGTLAPSAEVGPCLPPCVGDPPGADPVTGFSYSHSGFSEPHEGTFAPTSSRALTAAEWSRVMTEIETLDVAYQTVRSRCAAIGIEIPAFDVTFTEQALRFVARTQGTEI